MHHMTIGWWVSTLVNALALLLRLFTGHLYRWLHLTLRFSSRVRLMALRKHSHLVVIKCHSHYSSALNLRRVEVCVMVTPKIYRIYVLNWTSNTKITKYWKTTMGVAVRAPTWVFRSAFSETSTSLCTVRAHLSHIQVLFTKVVGSLFTTDI